MLNFNQSLQFEDTETVYNLCLDLQSVAFELGVDTSWLIGLDKSMDFNQLKTIELMLAEAIERSYEENKEKLRQLKRCPQGYKWRVEGTGWRCEGGMHYCDAAQIKQFME